MNMFSLSMSDQLSIYHLNKYSPKKGESLLDHLVGLGFESEEAVRMICKSIELRRRFEKNKNLSIEDIKSIVS